MQKEDLEVVVREEIVMEVEEEAVTVAVHLLRENMVVVAEAPTMPARIR